jgi:hypothetical protein
MTPDIGAPSIQAAGEVPAVSYVAVIALYDPRDGRVAHMHHTMTLEGAQRRAPEEQEASARDAARRLGCDVGGLEALHVENLSPAGQQYAVDLSNRTLVEVPLSQRRNLTGSG